MMSSSKWKDSIKSFDFEKNATAFKGKQYWFQKVLRLYGIEKRGLGTRALRSVIIVSL